VHATDATNIMASFLFTAIFHFLFLSYQYLVEALKTWFRRIAAFLVFILDFCPEHNSKSIQATDLQFYRQIDFIEEKCSAQELKH